MKISARNVIKGKIRNIALGTVNMEVILELPGGQEIVSVITRRSGEALRLEVGKEAYAVIKASHVMVATDA